MLGLTYIFPDEPIEEDDLFIMSAFPMPHFTRWLAKALEEMGILWMGSASLQIRNGQGTCLTEPNGESYVADYNIGCVVKRFPGSSNFETDFVERLKFWRWYNESYVIKVYNTSWKDEKVWIHFVITSRPKDFDLIDSRWEA